jgi:hypothetical protein
MSSNYDTFQEREADLLLEKLETGTLVGNNHDDYVPEAHLMGGATLFSNFSNLSNLQQSMDNEREHFVIYPWDWGYTLWSALAVMATGATTFFETYQIAFAPAGLVYPFLDGNSTIESILSLIFVIDIFVSFHLAYLNERHKIVCDKQKIAGRYLKSKFWVDLVAVIPFQFLALAATGQLGQETVLADFLALFRLLRLLRLYRVRNFFETLQYDTRISLMSLTLVRNFAAALVWTHLAACGLYFISKLHQFDPDSTWIGEDVQDVSDFSRYVTSLYLSTVTFATVGYGDFAPVSSAEKIWGILYMLSNIVIQAWIIGSITLLLIKKDEKTGNYRDTLETLDQYSKIHAFDADYHNRLKTQIQLDYATREIADEYVLEHFPASMRRNVLRKLYLPHLSRTDLMKGVRQQFVDAFLTTCSVEIFSPGEDILRRNSISSDLYLLVGGVVKFVGVSSSTSSNSDCRADDEGQQRKAGDFVNEIGFFTESPQIENVRTVTVCKTLTISRSAYKMLAQDHPGSAGKILQNLLTKAQSMGPPPPVANLPQSVDFVRAGSEFWQNDGQIEQTHEHVTAIQDLVKMHIGKQKDDHTTRFLFAASRGDTNTITIMCDQGCDPDSSDYDSRTALMVAAMKGNQEVVSKLLEYKANPNLVDMHGSSALYEAARNGHEDTMVVLLQHDASLCMSESLAASILDQAVFDGDMLLIRRLLQAEIQVNAVDYDKRAAVHIAAAEGNVAALKVMVEYGADLSMKDRWGNSVEEEAIRAEAGQVLNYLSSLK